MKRQIFTWREAIQVSGLPSTTRLVLFNLSTYMNDKGQSCFPSIKEQMADTGLSDRAIIEHLQKAVSAGFLFKKKVRAVGSKWQHSEYEAIYPAGLRFKDAEGVASDQPESAHDGKSPSENPPHDFNRSHHMTDGNTNSPVNSPLPSIVKEKNTKKKNPVKITLEDWEAANGKLQLGHMKSWVKEKNLDPDIITAMIENFRLKIQANGGIYVNFSACFKDWLTRGFLIKRLDECVAKAKPSDVKLRFGANV